MFPYITNIEDFSARVLNKPEIRFLKQDNGSTICCYLISDNDTFDDIYALEARGISFDQDGKVNSRPLHKFFNVGERPGLSLDEIVKRKDIARIYEKIDGSMIATAWVNGKLELRSKKGFGTNVVKLAEDLLKQPKFQNIKDFMTEVASNNYTAIFELMHPENQIVVRYSEPSLKLLHVRHNNLGDYLLLDYPTHPLHQKISQYAVPLVAHLDMTIQEAVDSIWNMTNKEGYVIQFYNGDMVKIKCPWYHKMHKVITFVRERDIAELVLSEQIDDVKSAFTFCNKTISGIERVEKKVKDILTSYYSQIEDIYQSNTDLTRKEFAIKYKDHPLQGPLLSRFGNPNFSIIEWYKKKHLKTDFNLEVLDGFKVDENYEDET